MAVVVGIPGDRRMTEDAGGATKAALEQLLDRALAHIQVLIQDDPIPLSTYRAVLMGARASNNAHDKSQVNSYDVEIQDQSLDNEIRDLILQELSEYVHDNMVRTALEEMYRLPHMHFSLDGLRKRLLDLAIILGAEAASSSFMRSLQADSCPYSKLALIGGVTLEEEIDLYDGIKLLPLPETDESLSSTYPSLLPDSELRHRFSEAVLIKEERTVSPHFMRPDANSKFVTEAISQQAPDFDPRTFCLIVSLVTTRHAYVSMEWASMSEDEFINLLIGSAFQYVVIQTPELSLPVVASEIAEAKTVYEQFRNSTPGAQKRLKIPLTRLAVSTDNNRSPLDRIIDLAIALESLYLPGIKDELSFRLKLRAAKHQEDTVEKRRAIAKTLDKFYDVRSRIAHTGSPPSEYAALADLIGILAATQAVCRRSIRKILEQGNEPDWSDIDYS